MGYPEINGDEYPNREAYEAGMKAKVKHRGAWPGNDTIWRMVGDLYKGMKKKERRYFSVVDGIVAGEGQGPFCPTSKNANTVIVGEDLLATDCAAVRYMGLDPNKVRYLHYFLSQKYEGISLEEICVVENSGEVKDFFSQKTNYLDFFVVEQWREIKYI